VISKSISSQKGSPQMSLDAGNEQARTAPAHRINWFAPERPVENGTVYVRPEPASDAGAPSDPAE
jgi:hypothetical protein